MLVRLTQEDYLTQLQGKLPHGPAWPRERDSELTGILEGFAREFARIHNAAIDLVDELNPATAYLLLPVWEALVGLPDECSRGIATTLQERRAAVISKLNELGGQSVSYMLAIAEGLGYRVALTEFRPFLCGLSQCGLDALNGPDEVRFYWHVRVLGPRVTWFRCGLSECGKDPLAKITRAQDLECRLYRVKPAHTILVLGYQPDPQASLIWAGAALLWNGQPLIFGDSP